MGTKNNETSFKNRRKQMKQNISELYDSIKNKILDIKKALSDGEN